MIVEDFRTRAQRLECSDCVSPDEKKWSCSRAEASECTTHVTEAGREVLTVSEVN